MESAKQRRILKKYKERGWVAYKIDPKNGVENGLPDIVCHGPNKRTVFIEVKKDGEVPTRIQDYQHRRLRDRGHEVIVTSDELAACEPLQRKRER